MGAGFGVCAAEASGVARRRVVAAGDGRTPEPRWAQGFAYGRPRQQRCRREPQPGKCRTEIPV